MQSPVQVRFQGFPRSDEIERVCAREARKLERYHGRMTSCHVVVGRSQHRHRLGDPVEVRVAVRVPGRTLAVGRSPARASASAKPLVALRQAFDSLRRRLEDDARVRRGAVKAHSVRRPRSRVLGRRG